MTNTKINSSSGCITTIIRLHSLLAFKTTIDPTWDYVPVTIWTELELASGFVCVSLPAIRILLVLIFPKSLFASISSKSRSRDAPEPNPETKKKEKKGFSWMHISTDNYDSNVTDSQRSRFWPSTSHSRSPSHRRLGSGPGEEVNLSHVKTCTSPVRSSIHRGSNRVRSSEQVKMLAVPNARHQQVCKSCGSEGEYVTALPRIGCLPDESFGKGESSHKSVKRDGRWWNVV